MSAVAAIAYAGYLVWLAAGCLDFLLHRRTDLPHTSGVAESLLHGVQLLLLALAVLAWLAFQPGPLVTVLLAALVVAHTVAGYVDTRIAFGRRRISPLEQHLHSVLDMAPWFALFAIGFVQQRAASDVGWTLAWRAASPWLWAGTLLPPVLLCLLPWLAEFRSALRARRP